MRLDFYWDEAGAPRARLAAATPAGAAPPDASAPAPDGPSALFGVSPAAAVTGGEGVAGVAGGACAVPAAPTPGAAMDGREGGGALLALLAGYLDSEVRGSVGQAREIVHVIDRILAGRLKVWSDAGGTHTLTLSRRGATVELSAGDPLPPGRLSLADTRQVAADWLAFLQRGPAGSAAPGDPVRERRAARPGSGVEEPRRPSPGAGSHGAPPGAQPERQG